MVSGNNEKTALWRIIEISIGLILSVTIAFTGWNFSQILILSEKVVTVQANYMTAREILELVRAMDVQFSTVDQKFAAVEQRLADKANRRELLSPQIDERVQNIQKQLDELTVNSHAKDTR